MMNEKRKEKDLSKFLPYSRKRKKKKISPVTQNICQANSLQKSSYFGLPSFFSSTTVTEALTRTKDPPFLPTIGLENS